MRVPDWTRGATDNVRSTTAHAQCHKIDFDLMKPGKGWFDATTDGGPPRRDCHGAEWFWTGVVIALAVVAVSALVLLP